MLWFKIAVGVFVSIPFFNKYTFHTVSYDEIKIQIKNGVASIQEAMGEGELVETRLKADTLIELLSANKDTFSQVGIQTAMFYKAETYKAEWKYELAIDIYNEMLEKYPQTLFAELIFQNIAISYEGFAVRSSKKNDKIKNYELSIKYYDMIVTNRKKTEDIPLYFNHTITPAKIPVYEAIYLEDAFIGIGNALLNIGQEDRGREYFQIVVDYFPDSENRDKAQKLKGDSYYKEGRKFKKQAHRVKDETDSKKAEQLYKRRFKQALITYDEFINKFPQSKLLSDVYIAKGEVYFELDEQNRGVEFFKIAVSSIKSSKDQARVQFKIANYYFRRKQVEKAIENYEKVIKNFPESREAANSQYNIGQCYKIMNKLEKEIEAYERVCDFYKMSQAYAPAAYVLGKRHYDQNENKKAISFLRKGVSLYPRSPVAASSQFLIGKIKQREQEYGVAIKEFEFILGDYPNSKWVDKAQYEIGQCYYLLKDEEKAQEAFANIKDRELSLIGKQTVMSPGDTDPDEKIRNLQEDYNSDNNEISAFAAMEMGKINLEEKLNFAEALKYFAEAAEKTEDKVKRINIKSLVAATYFKQGDYTTAQELYLKIMDEEEINEQVAIQSEFKVYETFRMMKQYAKARGGYEALLGRYPDHRLAAICQLLVGNSFSKVNKYNKAIEAYNKVLEDYSDSDVYGNAGLEIGLVYKKSNRIDEALDHLIEFVKNNQTIEAAPQLYYQIAEIYKSNKKNNRKAIENYLQVIDNFENSILFSAAAYHAGMAYIELGNKTEGKDVLEKVHKADVQFFKAASAEIAKIVSKGDYKEAISKYEQIEEESETDEDKALARLGIGDIYQNRKMFKMAARSFTKVIESYIDIKEDLRSGAFIKLIDSYNNLNSFNKVISRANMMIKEMPDNEYTINAIYFKANAYYSQRNYATGYKIFSQVIKRNENKQLTEVSYYQRAECLLFQNKQDEAISAYGVFIKKYPKSTYYPFAVYQQGNAFWAKENFEQAANKFKRVVDAYPRFQYIDMARSFLGYCYDRNGDWKKAREMYEIVIKRNRNQEAVKFSKEQLDALNVKH